jgi:hypothetical protein
MSVVKGRKYETDVLHVAVAVAVAVGVRGSGSECWVGEAAGRAWQR